MENKPKRTRLSKYQVSSRKYLSRLNTFTKSDKTTKEVFDAFKIGQNKYMRSSHIESATYDPKWIEMIEDCIPALGEIIKNPRKVTKTVTSVVPVELAKKTNDESIRHLASHTQYVKNVDEFGNIVPNKVLNIASDDDLLTYENKFIATLVKRLLIFVEKRYDFIVKFFPLKQVDSLSYKTKSVVDGSIVEVETKVKVTKAAPDLTTDQNNAYLKRVEQMRTYILYYYGSDFMKLFKNERDIRSPILQTNIIRKNPLYHKCYVLFKYLETYQSLGIDYKVKEQYQELKDADMRGLDMMGVSNFLLLKPDREATYPIAKSKVYKPRILKTCDDDPFFYGPVLTGNIEFLRVDDEYFDELEKSLKELNPHMTKQERDYEEENIKKKKDIENKRKLANNLKKRKLKEEKEFEKQQEILIEQEKKRQAKLLAEQEKARKKQEEAIIETAREDLKQTAIADKQKEEALEAERIKAEEEAARKQLEQPEIPEEESQEEE